ncbi:hypothetical protein L596_006140 [Steinernema carpocapsae]|uniref:Uncharacterized protein n=1 Tax=Steinernema carpocapsae TaxID=34508 RepID=A0A4U8V2S2_STECR|nr:hypothetical protein L596_006140 [Steinernema carpocapsae]
MEDVFKSDDDDDSEDEDVQYEPFNPPPRRKRTRTMTVCPPTAPAPAPAMPERLEPVRFNFPKRNTEGPKPKRRANSTSSGDDSDGGHRNGIEASSSNAAGPSTSASK